jgi:ankyrin repeat protein
MSKKLEIISQLIREERLDEVKVCNITPEEVEQLISVATEHAKFKIIDFLYVIQDSNELKQVILDGLPLQVQYLVKSIKKDVKVTFTKNEVLQAVKNREFKVIKSMFIAGIDLNFDFKDSPLNLAVKMEDLEMVDFLLKGGVSCVYPPENSPVWDAVELGSLEIVKRLLDSDFDAINEYRSNDNQKLTLLHSAIEQNNIPMIDLLIQKGSDPNAIATLHGVEYSPLNLAISKDNLGLVETLIRKGASITTFYSPTKNSLEYVIQRWGEREEQVTFTYKFIQLLFELDKLETKEDVELALYFLATNAQVELLKKVVRIKVSRNLNVALNAAVSGAIKATDYLLKDYLEIIDFLLLNGAEKNNDKLHQLISDSISHNQEKINSGNYFGSYFNMATIPNESSSSKMTRITKIIEFLVERGFDLFPQYYIDFSYLMFSNLWDKLSMVEDIEYQEILKSLLLKYLKKRDYEIESLYIVMDFLFKKQHVDDMPSFIDTILPNLENKELYGDLLRLAVRTGDQEVFQQLFDAGIRSDLLLHDAAANHQSKMCNFLMNTNKVLLNETNDKQETALHIAAKTLTNNFANAKWKDEKIKEEDINCIRSLIDVIDVGINVNHQNLQGETAAHIIMKSDINIPEDVLDLIVENFNPYLKDHAGNSLRTLALQQDAFDLFERFEQKAKSNV